MMRTVAKALPAVAGSTVMFDVVLFVLCERRMLGHGDLGLARFFWGAGAAAVVAAVTGLVAIAFGFTRHLDAFGVVGACGSGLHFSFLLSRQDRGLLTIARPSHRLTLFLRRSATKNEKCRPDPTTP